MTSDSASGVGVTVDNTATDYLRVASGVGPFDTYPVSGSRYLESLSAEGSTYFTASFDQPLRAIGFYITDASDWIGTAGPIAPLVVSLTTLSGTFDFDLTGSVDPTTIVDGNVAFFGALSAGDPITSVAIANPGSNPDEDAIGIDDVYAFSLVDRDLPTAHVSDAFPSGIAPVDAAATTATGCAAVRPRGCPSPW